MALCKAVGDEPQGQQVKLAARPWPYGEDVFWQVLVRVSDNSSYFSLTRSSAALDDATLFWFSHRIAPLAVC